MKTNFVGPRCRLAILVAGILLWDPACNIEENREGTGTALDFTLELVNGEIFDAADFFGSVVLVNFWAMWCGNCREEQDDLNRLYADYHDNGFEIIGIALARHGAPEVAAFLSEFGVQYTSGLVGESVNAQFGIVSTIPKTYIITRTGEIDSVHTGGLEYDNFAAMITPLLGH